MKRFISFSLAFLLMFAVGAFVAPSMASAQTTAAGAFTCNQYAILDNVTATTKVISAVAATTTTININGVPTSTQINSKRIRICNVSFRVKQAAGAANFGLTTGTGTNCGTGSASLTPQWYGTASVVDEKTINYGSDGAVLVPTAKDLCFALSAAPTNAQIAISYAVY
jgi:hypothetical protein